MAAARRITVDLRAGTAKFFADMDASAGKVRQFGSQAGSAMREAGGHTVSSMQAASAAVRTFEGNVTHNVRAVERFLTSVLPLGPVLTAAFPLIGAIAFGSLVVSLGSKLGEFYKNAAEGPQRINSAFLSIQAPLKLTNDELLVANDRLANDIAKLEGKHENTLALSLDEARVAADKLADSLERDLKAVYKFADDNSIGFFRSLLELGGNRVVTTDIAKVIGGSTGTAGDIAAINDITRAGQLKIDQAALAGDKNAQDAARKELDAKLVSYIQARIGYWGGELDKAKNLTTTGLFNKQTGVPFRNSVVDSVGNFEQRTVPRVPSTAEQQRIDELNKVIQYYTGLSTSIQLQEKNAFQTQRKDELQAGRENTLQDKPLRDRLKALDAQIEGVNAKFAAIGKPEAVMIAAKAFADAQKAIEEVNKALERHNKSLTDAEKEQIRSRELTIAQKEADTEWATKLASSQVAIEERVRSQKMLAEAIGQGYEATKQANVETRLMQELGAHYFDSDWMSKHAPDVEALRSGFGREQDAQYGTQITASLEKTQRSIELGQELARVQSEGAEAVRAATLAFRLREIAQDNDAASAKKLMAAEIELYNTERANTIAADVAKIDEKTSATERLTAAILKGAAAVRAATLANELEAISREGDIAVPGVVGIGARGLAATRAASAGYGQEVATAAARADRVQAISDEIAKLNEAKKTLGDTLGIEMALRDLENQRIHALAEESLALGTLRDGLRAFFIDMRQQAETTAQIIYNAMHSALDRTSGLLGKLATGQIEKGGVGRMFGKEFQSIGEEMTASSIKSLAQRGLGALGKMFGVDIGGTKPDGTAANPLWVRVVNGSAEAGLPSLIGSMGIPGSGGGGDAGSVFGGASKAVPFIFSMLKFGGFLAGGGDVVPGMGYMVGENGPEPFIPSTPGRILPNGSLGGDTHMHFNTTLDARGSNISEARLNSILDQRDRALGARVVQAVHERSRRVPQR